MRWCYICLFYTREKSRQYYCFANFRVKYFTKYISVIHGQNFSLNFFLCNDSERKNSFQMAIAELLNCCYVVFIFFSFCWIMHHRYSSNLFTYPDIEEYQSLKSTFSPSSKRLYFTIAVPLSGKHDFIVLQNK